MAEIPTGEKIAEAQVKAVAEWRTKGKVEGARGGDELMRLVIEQAAQNFLLWHEEDKARRTDVPDGVIAGVKHSIDKLNQKRNDLIEKLDEKLIELVGSAMKPDAPLNSETPGALIDRLAISALKCCYMDVEAGRKDAGAEHRGHAADKLAVLREQRKDLAECFTLLMDDVRAGRRCFKVYRQFKMYNDPSLNPEIYGRKGKK